MTDDPFETLCRAHRAQGREFPYVMGGLLGSGGMATVVRAQHVTTGRWVALKLLRDPGGRAGLHDFFHREIGLLRELRHRNIVQLDDYGDCGPILWVTMELCPGGNLADRVARTGPLSALEALTVAREAAAGLAHLHSHGYVHRDIKPQNILLDGVGTAKLADLGLAKNSELAGRSGFTRTGEWGGTIHFMAREQFINFRYVKPGADVFGLGGTLYWMLTGAVPRTLPAGTSSLQTVFDAEIVPIRQRNPNVSPDLALIVDRALSRNPADRHASARELHDELAAVSL